MSFKLFLIKRAVTMFGVLMATLLVTIALVGSNMDIILKQGVAIDTRQTILNDPKIIKNFPNPQDLEKFITDQIKQKQDSLGLDKPWYYPQRLGLSVYKILILDFGHAKFLTSDSGSSDVKD